MPMSLRSKQRRRSFNVMCEYFIFQFSANEAGADDFGTVTEVLKFKLKISRAHAPLAALPFASAPSTNLPVN